MFTELQITPSKSKIKRFFFSRWFNFKTFILRYWFKKTYFFVEDISSITSMMPSPKSRNSSGIIFTAALGENL